MSALGIRRNFLWLCFAIAASTVLLLFTARPATAQSDGAQLIGAQSHATWGSVSIADMRRELDLFVEAGANVVRADLAWSSLESEGNGKFSDWYIDRWDTFLAEAEARDLAVIATVLWTPCWASTAPESEKQGCTGKWWDRDVTRYPPADPAELGDAMEFIGDRWGHRLAAIEVWNEPNLPEQRFLRAGNSAATYTTLLRSAYPRIKAVAPDLPVLGGVIAWSDTKFLEAIYDHGAKGYFDGLAMHPYNEWRDPDDPWQAEWRMFSFLMGVPAMHQVMSEHGDGEKKLWLTEFGWSTCTDGDRWCVSVPDQARFIADSIPIIRSWDFVAAATVYQMRDADVGGCRECQFGMVHRDFTPKPSFGAFKEALTSAVTESDSRVNVDPARNVRLHGRAAKSQAARGSRCRRERRGPRSSLLAITALIGGGALVSCGNDEEESSGEAAGTTETTETPQTTEAAGPSEVTVTADEYSFELSETPISPGEVTFMLDNVGEQAHVLRVVRINAGFTLDEAFKLESRKGSAELGQSKARTFLAALRASRAASGAVGRPSAAAAGCAASRAGGSGGAAVPGAGRRP